MMSYINETDFVIENKELVYPEIITDGLQLYYDAKGKRDTDYHRDTMLDMSGNKNHGKLYNFAYEKHSGYKDGLVFDYIDDKLTMPKLNGINANNFTYQLNNNILAFTGDEVKTVKNGNIEVVGRNLLKGTSDSFKEINPRERFTSLPENSITPISEYGLKVGDTITFRIYIQAHNSVLANARITPHFTGGGYGSVTGNRIQAGEEGYSTVTYTIPSNVDRLEVGLDVPVPAGDTSVLMYYKEAKLEKGNKATVWTPAPEDLIKTTELKGNILGDMENIIDGLYKTEVLSGEEIYSNKADDSVVHVEVDGKSYQDGVPTPDYPIEIHSINDFDVVSSVGKENVILESDYIPYTQGIEETYKEHLCTKIASNTSTNSSKANINFSEELIAGSWYTFSVLVAYQGTKPDSIQLYLGGVHGYTIAEGFDSLVEGVFGRIYVTSKSTRNSTSSRPHLNIRGGDGHVYFTKWKLEKSDKLTDWAPAPEDILENDNHPFIDKINLLLSEPLRSVGDVKDRLFRNSDGIWKIERKIGEYVFGKNNKLTQSVFRDDYAVYFISNFNIKQGTLMTSSHFLRGGSWPSSPMNTIVSDSLSMLGFKVPVSLFPTQQDFDTWIEEQESKGTPLVAHYQLVTPTIEVLPQSLQDKLNNLRSFEDSNYVYTVLPNENNTLSKNLKPTLHAKFLYNNWYKEDRVINNLMIYNRALTNEEMLQNYKTIKRRWKM